MSGGTRVASAPPPADVGLVVAMPVELKPMLARLREVRRYSGGRFPVHEGTLEGRLVAAVLTGPGTDSSARGTRHLIAGHRPSWLVSAGFAGGLDPALGRHALVRPEAVIDEFGSRIRVPYDEPGDAGGGTLLTASRIIRTAEEKARLREQTGATCVDMETFAVASIAVDLGLRFLALRVISDPAGETLPPEVLSLVGPTGGYRVGAAVGAILKRPASLAAMLRMRDNANESAERLAVAVASVIPRLVPTPGSA
jgi:adenosylhomocysteine nucleosidase